MVPSTSCGMSQLMDDDFTVPDFSSHDDSRLQQDSLKRAFRQMGGEGYDAEHSILQVCTPGLCAACKSVRGWTNSSL